MESSIYVSFILDELKKLMEIDSPSGYTRTAADYLVQRYTELGYPASLTTKGGVLVDMGGEDAEDAILLEAHLDTLGGIVSEILPNGRLRISPLGGLNANNTEAENCRIITHFGKTYTGTLQLANASIHVHDTYNDTKRSFSGMEVLIDEPVSSREETESLGIDNGDIVCFDPRTTITESGYIKSRFLDDKLSVAILLGYAKYLKETHISTKRRIYQHITVYEEVGHGASGTMPAGVTEVMSVDMGCVGDGLKCTERMVSICAKDSGGPYSYEVVDKLIHLAKAHQIAYAVDVYPHYGSDAEAALRAGYDVKHGLIGAGVYASHGYERSHRDGVLNTLRLLQAYLG